MPLTELSPGAAAWLATMSERWEMVWQQWSVLADQCHVPDWELLQTTARSAWTDGVRAIGSTFHLLFLVLRPLVLLLYTACRAFVLALIHSEFIQTVLIGTARQAKVAAVHVYQFHRGLTRQQVLLEGVIMVGCVVLVRLVFWLRRQMYTRRMIAYMSQKQEQTRQLYASTVTRIAQTSVWLAAMVPHLLFLAAAVGVKLLSPPLVTWLAHTRLTALLSWWIPLFCTIGVLQEQPDDGPVKTDDKENTAQAPANVGTPSKQDRRRRKPPRSSSKKRAPRTPLFPRTTPRTPSRSRQTPSRSSTNRTTPLRRLWTPRKKTADTSNTETLEAQQEQWMQYWTVYAALQACQLLVWMIPPARWMLKNPNVQSALLQLELMMYVWYYCLPYLTVPSSGVPTANPLPWLADHIQHMASRLYDSLTVVSRDTWDNVVRRFQGVMDGLVVIRLLSESTATWWTQVLRQARGLVVPTLCMLVPFGTPFGLLYVQYLLPLTSDSSTTAQLHYWVVHGLLGAVWYNVARLVWWIPLINFVPFGLWCYLALPGTASAWYGVLEEELQALGLLPQNAASAEPKEYRETRTARALEWAVNKLPSGVDDTNQNDNDDDDNESAGDASVQRDDDDDVVMVDANGASNEDDDASSHGSDQGSVYEDEDEDANASSRDDAPVRRSTRRLTAARVS